jgi:quercetin dioxygenase-like cupin family protein
MVEITTLDELTGRPHAEVFDEHAPRAIRLDLAAGESLPEHTHPGSNVVLHVLEGELTLRLDGEPHDLSAGDVARFSGDREISPRAVERATAVLVFAPTA